MPKNARGRKFDFVGCNEPDDGDDAEKSIFYQQGLIFDEAEDY